ncbi:MAG: HupE/UreJ family protein [Deltaproteobacteria bacterium]|nr:MAG: HupE/UreJ family protein [Deltaproteobacteria bacterium]
MTGSMPGRVVRVFVSGAVLTASVLWGASVSPTPAAAHPVGFGVLQLEERQGPAGGQRPAGGTTGEWDVLLRVSGTPDEALAVDAVLPPACEVVAPPRLTVARRGVDRRFRVRCPSPLRGEVGVEGAGPSLSISLRLVDRDGETSITMLDGAAPTVTLEDGARLGGSVFGGYAALGVNHILTGVDHLLFVLGLLLLLRARPRTLALTITAFTVGHSVTLALATFDVVSVSSAAAEAIIALSILLLAVELAHPPTHPDAPLSLTRRYPGLVAGGFGLVHGLGFAGALREVGLPRDEAAMALFGFNVGVEAGQLLFVAVALLGIAGAARLGGSAWPKQTRLAAVYGMGALSAYFVIERLSTLIA